MNFGSLGSTSENKDVIINIIILLLLLRLLLLLSLDEVVQTC